MRTTMRRIGSLGLALACAALSAGGRPAAAADVAKGKTLYASRCLFCHGAAGKGDGPAGKALKPRPTNFASAEYWKAATPDAMKAIIQNGKPNTAMLAFKNALSAQDLDDLIAYLQTLKAPE